MQSNLAVMPEPRTRRDKGEGRVWKRGKVWWIQFYFRGQQVRESSKSERKQHAIELLKRRLVEAKDGAIVDGRVRYCDMRDALYRDYEMNGHKSLLDESRRHAICWDGSGARNFFGEYRAQEITTEALKQFVRERQREGIKRRH